MRIEKDKADWNDINNFSQQFEGIYLSMSQQPELSLGNKFLSRNLFMASPSGPHRHSTSNLPPSGSAQTQPSNIYKAPSVTTNR